MFLAGSSWSARRRLELFWVLLQSEVGGTHFKGSCKVKPPVFE